VKLTTHIQLVPRSRKCGSIHSLHCTPSWDNFLPLGQDFVLRMENVRSMTSYVRVVKLLSAMDIFIIMKVGHLKFFVFVFGGIGR
jgi:hypothetical protein